MAKKMDPRLWLDEHGDYLYRYAMSRLQEPELAQDMVQEALLAAWKGRDGFKGDSSVRTWLTGILKHKIIDHIRREIRGRRLHDAIENDPTSAFFDADGSWHEAPRAWKENPEDLCRSEQFHVVLDDCIGKLPEKQRVVFRLRELAGEDSESICKACDITSTNLYVLLHRARLALRKCLEMNWFGKEARR